MNKNNIIFYLFEAGIADTISSFKWMKNNIIYENRHAPNWIISLTDHLPKDMLQILAVFYLVWNLLEIRS